MNDTPLVTILVNNYNYGRFLEEALDSALNQTYRNTEVIVVDDGSTDNSRRIMATYGDSILRVEKENGGQASAFNAGFARSRGDWVFLLDSDDLFDRTKLERMMGYCREYPEAGLAVHNLAYCDEEGSDKPLQRASLSELRVVDDRERIRKGKLSVFLPATSGIGVRRDVLEKILPMPEDIVVVADNYVKLAAVGETPILTVPEPLATQRIHGSNLYTMGVETNRTRVMKNLMGAKIAFRLLERHPHLAKIGWKAYGRAFGALVGIRDRDAGQALKVIRAEYKLTNWSAPMVLYVFGAMTKAVITGFMTWCRVRLAGRFRLRPAGGAA